VRQVNTVITGIARGRASGAPQILDYTEVNLQAVSPPAVNRKFWKQRQIIPVEPRSKAFVFHTGAFVGIGTPSLVQAVASIYASVRMVSNYRAPACAEFTVTDLKPVNYVFTGTIPGPDGLPIKNRYAINRSIFRWLSETDDNLAVADEQEVFPGARVTFIKQSLVVIFF
jgi:hypothetical protein